MHKEDTFWELIALLDAAHALPQVMIVGSWAEYLYTFYFDNDYLPNLKSHDIDVLYPNPYLEADGNDLIVDRLSSGGFIPATEGGLLRAFYKDGLEVEFLTSQIGSGPGLVEIPYSGITAEKLNNTDMLRPIVLHANGYHIRVPSPASYLCHKLYINPERRPVSKRPKDVEAVRSLLLYLEKKPEETAALSAYLKSLSQDRQERIRKVAAENALVLP